MQLFLCKDNANREQNRQARLNVMPRCSFSCAKIMQIGAESPSLLERYAEMQLFLCKDNANRGQDKINSLIFNGFGCLIITPACLSYYFAGNCFARIGWAPAQCKLLSDAKQRPAISYKVLTIC